MNACMKLHSQTDLLTQPDIGVRPDFILVIDKNCCILLSVDLPPVGPDDLPLSLLEMGCSGRFELITHTLPKNKPLPPHSTVSHLIIL